MTAMNSPLDPPPPDPRYSRQVLYRQIGRAGQERLRTARIAIVGIGALGTVEATILARAGVGTLRLIDRDFVELSNLQRQVLFDEQDARTAMPKAAAAKRHLSAANSTITIDDRSTEVNAATIESLLTDVDVVVDGADNFEVRYLVNDFCVRAKKPWVYAAAVGTTGLLMPILPGTTPCLRCVFEEPPPAGTAATCDTSGVLGSTTATVGALAALEAIKFATGRIDSIRRGLLELELWDNEIRDVGLAGPRDDCPCCAHRNFPFLSTRGGGAATSLCGRDAIQVVPTAVGAFDFESVRARLAKAFAVVDNGFLLRFPFEGRQVTLFRDGRAIVQGLNGIDDAALARSIYSRTIGA